MISRGEWGLPVFTVPKNSGDCKDSIGLLTEISLANSELITVKFL
jgi:hypothetical protein